MTSLDELVKVWCEAERLSAPGGTDYARVRVSGGDHADVPTDDSVFGELERRVRALATVYRRRVEEIRRNPGPPARARNGRPDLSVMRANLDSHQGCHNVEVAYLEDCSVDSVRQERKRRGLNEYGYRLPAPITARSLTSP